MSKTKTFLSEDSIIAWNNPSVGEYRNFFEHEIGKDFSCNIGNMDFQTWLFIQTGKTLKEAVEEYFHPSGLKNMEEILLERRFNIISGQNKTFIMAFDRAINELGYDFGGQIGSGACWGKNMIIYSQSGVKSKKIIARIFIRDTDVIPFSGSEIKYENSIVVRLMLSNINKHEPYIENAPSHIKTSFVDKHGLCKHCKKDCRTRKIYTIDGKEIEKCAGLVFEFHDPKIEFVGDYMNLLKEFYGKKPSRK